MSLTDVQREVLGHYYREIAGLELERDKVAGRLSWIEDEIAEYQSLIEKVSAPGWEPPRLVPPPGGEQLTIDLMPER